MPVTPAGHMHPTCPSEFTEHVPPFWQGLIEQEIPPCYIQIFWFNELQQLHNSYVNMLLLLYNIWDVSFE